MAAGGVNNLLFFFLLILMALGVSKTAGNLPVG